jgi:hypothetical protein
VSTPPPHDDMFKVMCVQQGYVPKTCTLPGTLVWYLIKQEEDPCAGCNMDRQVCLGRPKKGERWG